MANKFNHLNVPDQWNQYWSRYPQGYTILEALISWVSQVDSMVDNQNKLNGNVEQFRNEIDEFVGRFDNRLQDEVTQTLKDWQTAGFLDEVINEALQWQLDDYITTNEQDKVLLTAQLHQTELNKVDKDGSGQIGWANIAQDARLQIIGTTPPAVVSDNSVITSNLTNKAVTPKKTSFVSVSYGINLSKESEATLTDNNFALKMPVHLEPSKSYRVGKNAGGASNVSLKIKNRAGLVLVSISSYQNLIMEGTAFTTDGTFDANEVYYLHCNFVNDTTAATKLTGWCVKETATSLAASDYVPYSETPNMIGKINNFSIHADVPATLANFLYPYKDKKLATYGDSVTAQQQWQGSVMNTLGFTTLYNYGLGGAAAYQDCRDQVLTARITASDWDVLTVMYGINDWAQDRVVGTVTDTNPTGDFSLSFSGSINSMIDKLRTLYPTKRIVFMTPPPASYTAAEFFLHNGSADGLLNSNGNTLQDFSAAIIACCKRKSIPCIDLNGNVGWGPINIATYVTLEGTKYIHPNATGGTRMAEVITGGLRQIK